MSLNHYLPKKIDLKPKKHHGFYLVLFLLGLLLPPLAVAARFGIGKDFAINVILCIAGYFPCHFHNFYIQNIRNNTNRARTPKWAIKAGIIDTSDNDRRSRKNQWAKRYDERNTQSTHVGQALEEGEIGDDYTPVSERDQEADRRRQREGLWNEEEDAEYYNEDRAPNQRSWHYPTNFEGAVVEGSQKRGGSKRSGDRWARSRASRSDSTSSGSTYPPAASVDDDVPEWGRDYGSKRRSSKSKKKNNGGGGGEGGGGRGGEGGGRGGWASNGGYENDVANDDGWGSSGARGGDGGGGGGGGSGGQQQQKQSSRRSEDVFNHEF